MTWRDYVPREPVLFNRIFMGTTGLIATQTGAVVLWLSVWRLFNPAPAPLPVPAWLRAVFSFEIVLSILCIGVSLVMIALSNRLWRSN